MTDLKKREQDGYLTQGRKFNYDGAEYIKGTHEPIVTEEDFKEVQRIKADKTINLNGNPTGANVSKKVLGRKMTCKCGSRCGLRNCGNGKQQFKCSLTKRKDGLITMRADGEIDKYEYLLKIDECKKQLDQLEEERDPEKITSNLKEWYEQFTVESHNSLKANLNFSGNAVSDIVIEKLVEDIIHIAPYRYYVYLKLSTNQYGKFGEETHVIPYKTFNCDEYNKQKVIKCTKVFEHTVNLDRAKEYCKEQNRLLKFKCWNDIVVTVYMVV